jgi:hypothetical protein
VRGRITVVLNLSGSPASGGKRQLILLRGEAQLGLIADRIEAILGLEPDVVRPTGRATAQAEEKSGWPPAAPVTVNGRELSIIDAERLALL